MPSQLRRILAGQRDLSMTGMTNRSHRIEDLSLLGIVSVSESDLCGKAAHLDSGIVAGLGRRHRPDKESCYLDRCHRLAGRQIELACRGP
jgi:hypothetical protein